jgi:hypothetical protein
VEKDADDLEIAFGLLEDGRVRAVLEQHLAGAADAADERVRDQLCAEVVAASEDERGHVELVEPRPHIPAL